MCGLCVGWSGKKEMEEGEQEEEKEVNTKPEEEEMPTRPRPLHRTNSIFLRNLAPTITKQEVEAVSGRRQHSVPFFFSFCFFFGL